MHGDGVEYKEEDLLLLSGIQHFAFCRRQWALIYIEQQWSDNVLTVEGDILHEKAHNEKLSSEKRGDLIISRGMPVVSRTLGVTGACDIVEFYADPNGIKLSGRKGLWSVVPVEYKRGRAKTYTDADVLQLCCQAMCLEEMLLCDIPKGYIFYGEVKHREEILLSDEMRERVKNILREMHGYAERGYTPKVKPSVSCRSCSVKDICLPKITEKASALSYLKSIAEEE